MRSALLPAAILALAGLSVAMLSADGATGADGAAYLRLADHLAGGGNVDNLPAATRSGTERFAVWPPGYPMLVAVVQALTGLSAWASARVTNLLSLLALGALLHRWVPDRGQLAMAMLITGSGIRMAAHTASELPFLVAMVALSALLSTHTRSPTQWTWVGLALVTAALFFLRYLGLFAVGVLGVVALAQFRRPKLAASVALAAVPTVVLAWMWLLKNQLVTGHMTGMQRTPAPESLLTLGVSLARAGMAELIVPVSLISTRPDHLAALALGIAGTGWALWTCRRERPVLSPEAPYAALVGGSYLAALIGLRFTRHFDLFGWRLLFPGVALLLLAVGLSLRSTVATRRAVVGLASLSILCQVGLAATDGGRWSTTRDATLARYADLEPGCIVGPHDVHLPFLRPDLRTALPRIAPYGVPEPVDAFRERLSVSPGRCRVLEVRHDVREDRHHASWMWLKAEHDDGRRIGVKDPSQGDTPPK